MKGINDLYQKITAQIVAQLEDDVLPWHRPWASNPAGGVSRPLRENAVPYRGINILILWAAAIERGYASPFWMTCRQASSIGAQVRRGEKAAHVVLAKTFKKRERDDEGTESEAVIPFRRAYAVFNADQIDELPAKYVPETPAINDGERDAACERWFANLGLDVAHGGDQPCYAILADRIQMPTFASFVSPGAYYATLAHEAVHWTGAATRLDRQADNTDRRARAREELVAELGSAFLCADLGLTSRAREDHAPYIASWLELLTDEPRAIFDAATRAQEAAEYLQALQPAADRSSLASRGVAQQ